MNQTNENLSVVSANGIGFRAVLVPAGTQSPTRPNANRAGRDTVELYDARYPFTQYGQFVTALYADAIRQHGASTLCLDFGIPDWTISGDAMGEIVRWLS